MVWWRLTIIAFLLLAFIAISIGSFCYIFTLSEPLTMGPILYVIGLISLYAFVIPVHFACSAYVNGNYSAKLGCYLGESGYIEEPLGAMYALGSYRATWTEHYATQDLSFGRPSFKDETRRIICSHCNNALEIEIPAEKSLIKHKIFGTFLITIPVLWLMINFIYTIESANYEPSFWNIVLLSEYTGGLSGWQTTLFIVELLVFVLSLLYGFRITFDLDHPGIKLPPMKAEVSMNDEEKMETAIYNAHKLIEDNIFAFDHDISLKTLFRLQ